MTPKPNDSMTGAGIADWDEVKLGEIGRVIRGASPRPKGDKRFYGGDIPRLMVEDVTRDGKTVIPQVDFLTAEGAKRSRPCKKGTLTIVCSGTVGVPSFLGVDACIHDGFLALVSIRTSVSSHYLYYQFDRLRQSFENSATHGGVFTNLTTAGVREFVVPLPPTLAEQDAIAGALSDVDALIGSLDRLIAKKRDLKQAAMQQLLTGQTRLPGFKGEWEMVTLGDVFTFKNGLNKAKEFFGTGTPIVNYMDVYKGTSLSPNSLTGRVSVTPQELKGFSVQKGDVFFTRTSETTEEIGLAAVMANDCRDTVFSGFLLRARPKVDVFCDAFKKYCFRAEAVRSQIVSRASYTTRALTNGRLLSLVRLPCPPEVEQRAIATVLSDMDAELSALEQRRDKTRLLKQGMMQELLTGRTRLV